VQHSAPRRRRDLLIFAALGAIWGTNFLFMKLAVRVVSPLQVVWLRVVFGAVPLLLFALWRGSLALKDWRSAHLLLLTSLLSTVVPYLGFVKGTQLLASGAAGAISGVVPLMTALVAASVLPAERIGRRKAVGLALGLAGVLCVADVTSFGSASSGRALVGTLYMLMGAAGYACGLVYVRKYVSPLGLSPIALAGYQTAGAAVLLTPCTPLRGIAVLLDAPGALAAVALGLGLLGTGVAFILYYRLIETMGAVSASSVFYVPPAVALVVGAAIGHEGIALTQCLGAVLILLGVFLARQPLPSVATKARGDSNRRAERRPFPH
jgi:drug/metabolite transporter (DMT)-like permease